MDTSTILDEKPSSQDLESIVRHQITLLGSNRALGKLPPLMIWGAPGVGKSSILRDVAKRLA